MTADEIIKERLPKQVLSFFQYKNVPSSQLGYRVSETTRIDNDNVFFDVVFFDTKLRIHYNPIRGFAISEGDSDILELIQPQRTQIATENELIKRVIRFYASRDVVVRARELRFAFGKKKPLIDIKEITPGSYALHIRLGGVHRTFYYHYGFGFSHRFTVQPEKAERSNKDTFPPQDQGIGRMVYIVQNKILFKHLRRQELY